MQNDANKPMPLSAEEVKSLRTKVGKSHHAQKDWDFIRQALEGRLVYTALPLGIRMKRKYSTEGVLTHGGAMLIFSSQESCQNYLHRIGMGAGAKYMSLCDLPLDKVREIAARHEKNVYLDLHMPVGAKIIGIDGRTGALRIYHMKQ